MDYLIIEDQKSAEKIKCKIEELYECRLENKSTYEQQKLKNCISAHVSRFRGEQETRKAQNKVKETNGKLKIFMD